MNPGALHSFGGLFFHCMTPKKFVFILMEYGQSCSQKQVDVIFPYIRCRNVHLPLKIIIPANVAELHVVWGHQLLAQTAGGEGGMGEQGKYHSDENSLGSRIRPSRLVFGLYGAVSFIELTPGSFPDFPLPFLSSLPRVGKEVPLSVHKIPCIPLSFDLSQCQKVSFLRTGAGEICACIINAWCRA